MAQRVERPLPAAEVACLFITEQRRSLYWSQPSLWCSRRESPGPGMCVRVHVCTCMCTNTCVCTHTHVYMYVCAYVCMCGGGLPEVRVEKSGMGSPSP